MGNGLAAARQRWQTSAALPGKSTGPEVIHASSGPRARAVMTQLTTLPVSSAAEVRGARTSAGAARLSTHGPASAETVSARTSITVRLSAITAPLRPLHPCAHAGSCAAGRGRWEGSCR
ncbi:hypothetical protein ACFFX0_31615 [Citricoccus parietis]|uniref:Uncharacterized protein n=1 Tax=Citricoccus parietis TaxID=592307 RepID=A0ABV5G967_9MICC